MIIDVLQKDIDYGVRKACMNCPISRAIARAVDSFHVVVTPVIVRIYKKELIQKRYSLPSKAQDFVLDFDNGRAVKPFTFELDIK